MFALLEDPRETVHPLRARIIPTMRRSLDQLTEVASEVVDEATSNSEVAAVAGDAPWMSVVVTCFQLAGSEVLPHDLVATYLVMAGIQNVEMIDASIAEKMRGDQNGWTGKGSESES